MATVVNTLFDTLSFTQGPYLYMIIAAMCSVAVAPKTVLKVYPPPAGAVAGAS